MLVADFDFPLPPELIAQAPPAERGTSRLLVLERATGRISHGHIGDLPGWLQRGDVLVVNDTRVYPARLLGRREPSGGRVEVFLLERLGADRFDALVHPGQKLKPGGLMVLEGDPDPRGTPAPRLFGRIEGRGSFGRRTIRFGVDGPPPAQPAAEPKAGTEPGTEPGPQAGTEAEAGAEPGLPPMVPPGAEPAEERKIREAIDRVVDRIGHVPLPPYIARPDADADRERYQTVYARERGSVAAPTAGLHFTPAILAALEASGVERAAVTLHVGYGTFKPVRVDEVEAHVVDPERYTIATDTADRLNAARAQGRRLVAVGTTTVRALESAGRGGPIAAGAGVADVFLHPGGTPVAHVDALLTNFHLPRSSLLMLVCAFAGREAVLRAYHEAVAARYRFYSYGDAMLIV
ncbi:MAG: tRNA preQ1(34) S-adenosylmethionine ribosyltransferase-isomerase QueA [Vicinamibacteraceae bacterium]